MWELVSILGCMILCWAFYRLGQETAWKKITSEYIAIHKSAVIGPILIKNNGGYKHGDKKNKSSRTYKKSFTQKRKYH